MNKKDELSVFGSATEKEIQVSSWYLAHRQKIKTILLIVLIGINLGLWAYSITHFILYFSRTTQHQQMLSGITQNLVNTDIIEKNKPKALNIIGQGALRGDQQGNCFNYDFWFKVNNPNAKWGIVKINYIFTWLNGQSEIKESFLLPQQTKYLLTLRQCLTTAPQGVKVKILQVEWRRLSQLALEEISYLHFPITESEFIVGKKTENDNISLIIPDKLQFIAHNNTVYSFWHADFNVILFQNKKVVGVNIVNFKEFLSNQARAGTVIWNKKISLVDQQLIEPNINIFDKENIISLKQ